VLAPGLTALVVAYGYVLTAPLGVLTAPLRERLFGSASVAPPRTRMPSVFLPLDDADDGDDEGDEGDDAVCPPDTDAGNGSPSVAPADPAEG
jgi:CDP-diacylglycerol--serine O-phosphatidyltransferase